MYGCPLCPLVFCDVSVLVRVNYLALMRDARGEGQPNACLLMKENHSTVELQLAELFGHGRKTEIKFHPGPEASHYGGNNDYRTGSWFGSSCCAGSRVQDHNVFKDTTFSAPKYVNIFYQVFCRQGRIFAHFKYILSISRPNNSLNNRFIVRPRSCGRNFNENLLDTSLGKLYQTHILATCVG